MFISLVAAVVLASSAPVSTAYNDVWQAEQAFDAYTHDHGYTHGFLTWSAPDAIDFSPQAGHVHDRLAPRFVANGEKDAPSKLRWRPYWIEAAGSGDLAWDLGPWTYEGSDKAGWFFTVWQKQEDGSWRWVLDTGAGPDALAGIPGSDNILVRADDRKWSSGIVDDALAANSALDQALSRDALHAYDAFTQLTVVASDEAPPATKTETIASAVKTRPAGLTWTIDGKGTSKDRGFVYTYGHALAADGAFKGHYVRVWRHVASGWRLDVDIWQSA